MTRLAAERNVALRRFDFYLFETDVTTGDLVGVARPVDMLEYHDGRTDIMPAFSLNDDAIQDLMDSLWNAGVRPAEYHSVGQAEAMQAHISDLRRIVFSVLRIDKRDD